MRIISQDECYDLPYERTILCLSENGNVMAYISEKIILLAKYSSLNKAAKAMEMCRERYLGTQTWTDKYGSQYSLSYNADFPKVFQFPEEEEVEV